MADCKRKTANLFSDKLIGMTWWDGVITADERFTLHIAEVKPNTEYTASGNNSVDNIMVTYYSVYPAEGQSSVESVRYVYPTNPTRSVATFTTPDDSRIKYAAVRFGSDATEVMFNLGSIAFTYEPYGWVHSLRKLSTDTDTITTLPAVIYPNDATATVGLKGNMSQNGTPTPDNPVMPEGTGERTGNLFDVNSTSFTNGYLDSDGNIRSATGWKFSDYIEINAENVTISGVSGTNPSICVYDENKAYIRGAKYNNRSTVTISCVGASYVRVSCNSSIQPTIMLNTGSTALPYEPYGYKIPISSASTTTPVYLGEVESTRRIKKLVLTGGDDEIWNITNTSKVLYLAVSDFLKEQGTICYCTHYKTVNNVSFADDVNDGECTFNDHLNWLYIKDSNYTSAQGFKNYLAAQYAAGTPVCVWYVLATEETGIVNEPIRKIGDYADEVSGITIPVTAGGDTISVDTTLQPSEVTVNYKGWHPAIVHECTNGAWT